MMKAEPLKPVKIMLIGDSITEGRDSSGSYRRYLDGMLRRAGRLIDFVGSRESTTTIGRNRTATNMMSITKATGAKTPHGWQRTCQDCFGMMRPMWR